MDPISITVGCISLAAGITKLSVAISGFVGDVQGTHDDLNTVSKQLGPLQAVLQQLAKDADDKENPLPEILRNQLIEILSHCNGVIGQLETVLRKHQSNRVAKGPRWAISGKPEVAKLRSTLEVHKSALDLALGTVAL
jgi:hypothetical protein